MAHAQPDLFYAYIGTAQVVNWRKNLSASYARMLEIARVAGDQQAITALTTLGPPHWDSPKNGLCSEKWSEPIRRRE